MVLTLGGFMLATAGCQSGDSASDAAKPAEPKVLASELRAYCPRVMLREGTAFVTRYAKGGDGDASKLAYQASISDVTRSCTRSGGMLTLNVAAAGKIVPGPAGAPASITLPIRIVAMQGETVLYSQLFKHPVTLGDTTTATQFVFNEPNVSIPDPQQPLIQLYAGFDEGPAKPSLAEAEETF